MKWYEIVLGILLVLVGYYLHDLVYKARIGNMDGDTFIEKLYFKIQDWREKRKEKKKVNDVNI